MGHVLSNVCVCWSCENCRCYTLVNRMQIAVVQSCDRLRRRNTTPVTHASEDPTPTHTYAHAHTHCKHSVQTLTVRILLTGNYDWEQLHGDCSPGESFCVLCICTPIFACKPAAVCDLIACSNWLCRAGVVGGGHKLEAICRLLRIVTHRYAKPDKRPICGHGTRPMGVCFRNRIFSARISHVDEWDGQRSRLGSVLSDWVVGNYNWNVKYSN